MGEFWVPRSKKDLVSWLTNRGLKGMKKLGKAQLYAIYYIKRRELMRQ
jgi:hypothetical protein